ncbi:hypothetical protein DEU56DRAFT_912328 [Suillus clintonianus]|uniref:uncharacterized protein n=1 Tax=Suillus clintonianus TaxID=1904413 RepID=UPI001B88424A|nr:uncharacterized protein DEU56DRAFT_912328 [Suillus clintonianus]KAG2138459.1 hypothetical protein DEU56DRAFT_912328 [Suillus clintonianus]
MVRNLPWSTANEDLIELFETTGQVELAEILFDGARSKGCGVVQFAQVPEAETAIVHVWWTPSRRSVQRSMAYIYTYCRKGRSGDSHAGGVIYLSM